MRKCKQHKSVFYQKLYAVYRDRLCEQLNPNFPMAVLVRHEIRHDKAYNIFVILLISFDNYDFK